MAIKRIENYTDLDVQIQPSGFDFTVGKIGTLLDMGTVDFDNTDRRIPPFTASSNIFSGATARLDVQPRPTSLECDLRFRPLRFCDYDP